VSMQLSTLEEEKEKPILEPFLSGIARATNRAGRATHTFCFGAQMLIGLTLILTAYYQLPIPMVVSNDMILLSGKEVSKQKSWITSVANFQSPEKFCRSNPYVKDWDDSKFLKAAESLVSFRSNQNDFALERHWKAEGWGRFDASPSTVPCNDFARFPLDPIIDGGKWLCGISSLKKGCIIYSLGSNAQFDFEYLMVENTPCEIYTFDCTVSETETRFPKDLQKKGLGRIHFFPLCVSDGSKKTPKPSYRTLRQLAQDLNHTNIDLLKMDVEGFEYRVLAGLFTDALEASKAASELERSLDFLPMQISFELHTRTDLIPEASGLIDEQSSRAFDGWYNFGGLSAGDMQIFWNQLTDLGYAVVSRENNSGFSGGAEFTALRVFC
jgi:FkbM family methyltransferase